MATKGTDIRKNMHEKTGPPSGPPHPVAVSPMPHTVGSPRVFSTGARHLHLGSSSLITEPQNAGSRHPGAWSPHALSPHPAVPWSGAQSQVCPLVASVWAPAVSESSRHLQGILSGSLSPSASVSPRQLRVGLVLSSPGAFPSVIILIFLFSPLSFFLTNNAHTSKDI